MYEKGYDCINTNDGDLYIVPGAGYYYDYLNQNHIANSWQPNKIGGFTIPVGSEQMLGSTFAVWNDMTGPSQDNGTSDVEVFDRIFHINFNKSSWNFLNASLFPRLYSSVPICTTVPLGNTGSSPLVYSANTLLINSSASGFSTSKYSLLSALAKSGLARTKAPECPGLSNSGTISTPYFFDVLIKSLNSSFV